MHFIPERLKDGYGLQPAAIERLCERADGLGVRVAFEPEPGMFIGNLADYAELLTQAEDGRDRPDAVANDRYHRESDEHHHAERQPRPGGDTGEVRRLAYRVMLGAFAGPDVPDWLAGA